MPRRLSRAAVEMTFHAQASPLTLVIALHCLCTDGILRWPCHRCRPALHRRLFHPHPQRRQPQEGVRHLHPNREWICGEWTFTRIELLVLQRQFVTLLDFSSLA